MKRHVVVDLAEGGGKLKARPVVFVPLAVAAVVGFVLACGGDDTALLTWTAVPTVTAPADRTGIAEVDAVIGAVLSGDPEALRPLVRFTTRPCVPERTAENIGEPLCHAGEADGTLVDFLPETISGQCRIAARTLQVRAEEIDPVLGLPGFTELYAVYQAVSAEGAARGYTAVFAGTDPEARYEVVGAQLVIEDGQVVSMNYHCGEARAELVESVEAGHFVLPPREP